MLKKMGVVVLASVGILTQTGCMSTGGSSDEADVANLRVNSEVEEKILKESAVAGTIGGLAVAGIIVSTVGEDWPGWLKAGVLVGGPLIMKQVAEYVAMGQIEDLKDVTLENDEKEALLVEARKVNSDVAKLNEDLKSSIDKYKKDQTGLADELEQARLNQEQAEIVLENRKKLLSMLVADSEQHKEFSAEVAVLEKENKKLASIIDELSALEAGAV